MTGLVLNVTSPKALCLYLCKEAAIGQSVRELNSKNNYRYYCLGFTSEPQTLLKPANPSLSRLRVQYPLGSSIRSPGFETRAFFASLSASRTACLRRLFLYISSSYFRLGGTIQSKSSASSATGMSCRFPSTARRSKYSLSIRLGIRPSPLMGN